MVVSNLENSLQQIHLYTAQDASHHQDNSIFLGFFRSGDPDLNLHLSLLGRTTQHSYHPTHPVNNPVTPLGWLFPRLGHLCSVVETVLPNKMSLKTKAAKAMKSLKTKQMLYKSCFTSTYALVQSMKVSSRFLCALPIFLKRLNNIQKPKHFS